MSWTKGQLVTEALGELALAGYAFDVNPEETQSALRRLEALWGTWAGKGINAGYRFAASPESVDPDEDSGLPLYAIEATFLHLAERIAGGYGKALPQGLRARASEGYETLVRKAAFPAPQQIAGGIPLGAGHKGPWLAGPRFTAEPDAGPLQVADNGDLTIGG